MQKALVTILSYWQLIALLCLIATSVSKVALVNDSRNEVRNLFALKLQEEALLKENKNLVLENSVLTRPTRLQEYAKKQLKLSKPQQVHQLGAE